MTQKFWVGNGGNWNDTAHWSLISGGASGAAVPTSADNVRFDALSFTIAGQIVTGNAIMNCLDLDWTGILNAPSFVSSVYSISIYGNLTLWLGLNWNFTGTAYTYIIAGTTNYITCNGVVPSMNWVYMDSISHSSYGTIIIQDAFNSPAVLFPNYVTLNTNGKTVTCNYINTTTSNTFTLTLGSSIINCTQLNNGGYSHIINAGTSTLNIGLNLLSGGNDLYNVNFTGTTGGWWWNSNIKCNNITKNTKGVLNFNGNTKILCNNLTIKGTNSSTGRSLLSGITGNIVNLIVNSYLLENVNFRDVKLISSSIELVSNGTFNDSSNWTKETGWDIVNGVAKSSGANTTKSIFQDNIFVTGKTYVISLDSTSTSGTLQLYNNLTQYIGAFLNTTRQVFYVTANTNGGIYIYSYPNYIGSIDNVSIKEVLPIDLSTILGGAGDCGGNSNITFTSSQTQYYKHTSGACNWADDKWFTDYSPRTSVGRSPLPQDDVILDALSFSGASTLTVNVPIMGRSLDMSAVSQALSISIPATIEIYGSFILGTNITITTGLVNLWGRGNYDCKTLNKSLNSLTFGQLSTYTLQSDLSVSLYIQTGANSTILYGNGFNVTCRWIQNGNTTDKIYFGSGTWTYNLPTNGGAGVWSYGGTNATTYYETSTVIYTTTYTTMTGTLYIPLGGSYNILRIGNIPSVVNINLTAAAFTANQFIVDTNNKIFFLPSATYTIAKLKAMGKPGALITFGSQTPGSKYTLNITSSDNLIDYISVSDCTMTTPRPVGLNSVNVSNNTGLDFTTSLIRYWIGDTGNFTDIAHWSLQSGGTANTTAPTATENAIWDRNSFTAISKIVTGNSVMNCLTMDWSDVTKACSFVSSVYELNVYGSLSLSALLTWGFSATAYSYMKAVDARNITNNGCSISNYFFINSTGVISQQDTMSCLINVFLTGTYNTNDRTINANSYQFRTGTTATVNLGNSTLNLGNGITVNAGTETLNAGMSTIIVGVGSDWFLGGGKTYYNVIVETSTRVMNGYIDNFTCTNFTRRVISTGFYNCNAPINSAITVTGNLTLTGYSATNRLLINSFTAGVRRTINADPLKTFITNTDFKDIGFSQSTDLSNASGGSQDFGNNFNIIFSAALALYYKGTTGAHNWADASKWFLSDKVTLGHVPLLQDDIRFDDQSFTGPATLTLNQNAYCKSMNWSGQNKAVTLNGSVYSIYIYGDVILFSGLTITLTGTSYWFLKANDARTITTNGVIGTYNLFNVELTPTGSMTQTDDLSTNSTWQLNSGTWNTGNKNITMPYGCYFWKVGNVASTLNAGSSILTGGWSIGSGGGNTTFNCGTSTIVATGDMYPGTFNYWNVKPISTVRGLRIGTASTMTVLGTLYIIGNSPTDRMMLYTIYPAQGYSYVKAANIVASYANFKSINTTGSTGNWNLTDIVGGSGDCGGNTGIIFSPAIKLYYKHTLGACNWNDINKWFTLSGGSIQSQRVPLPQDDVTFDVNSFTGASTLNIQTGLLCRNLDMLTVSQPVVIASAIPIEVFGDYLIGSNVTGLLTLFMSTKTTATYKCSNQISSFTIYSIGGTINLQSDLISIGNSLYTGAFAINANGFNITVPFIVYSTGGFTLNMGTGTLFITGAYSTVTPFQLSPGIYDFTKATIRIQTSGVNEYSFIASGAGVINKLVFEGVVTGNYKIVGACTINELWIKEGLKVKMPVSVTNTIGKVRMLGKPGALITMYSETPGTAFNMNITSADNLIDYTSFQDCTLTTSRSVGLNSVNVGNNTGQDFATAIHRYWIGDTGNFNDDNHWSLQSGGVANTIKPTAIVNALVDRNSFSAIGKVITMNGIGNCLTLDLSDITKTASLVGTIYSLNVFGSLTLGVGLTWNFTGTSYLNLKATDIRAIAMNGVIAATNRMIFDGVNGTWINQDNMTISGSYIYLTNGTWNTNNKTIVVGIIISQPEIKTLTLGSSDVTFGGVILDNNNINLTVNAGTSIVRSLANAFTAATCIFNDLFIRCTNGGINTTFISCNNLTIYNLTNFITGCISIVGNIAINKNFNIIGVNNNIYRLMLNSDKNNRIITVDPTKVFASNVDFADIKFATPVDLSTIPGGAGDCGGNSNITFSPAIEQFWVGNAGNWSDQNHWASVSNGVAGSGRMPLPQDFAKVDDASFTVPGTITVNVPRLCKKLDMSTSTKDITFFNNISLSEFYGDFILGPKVISTGTTIAFIGRGIFDMNTFNKTVNVRIKKSATYNLRSEFTGSLLIEGNFYTNDYVLNIITDRLMSYSGSQLWLGNSIVNLITQGIGGELLLNAGGQLFSEDSIINVLSDFPSDIYLSMDGWILNKVVIDGTFTGNCKITGSNTFNELIIKEGKKIAFAAYATQIFNTIKTLSTHKKKITIGSTIPGTQAILVKNGLPIVEIENVIISDISASPNEKWYLGDNSKNNGNNSGLIFESSYIPPYSWM